jgi:hypothetical protein
MYKTTWVIDDEMNTIEFTYYHFGKEPKFPTWYMEENVVYNIEMLWNTPLINTLPIFFKCLFHEWTIRERKPRKVL